jgi:uncharacterized membrane-anchored protein YhcB (DUF1043 family)
MQENVVQPIAQPLMKLAQANMALFTRFAMSPEVMSEAMSSVQNVFRQAQESALHLAQSGAAAELMQGMARNYTEFIAECSKGGMNLLGQSQEAFMRQAQEASDNVIEVGRNRRRQTAA